MKSPRFTDSARYPHGYRTAAATNLRATFARVRAEQREQKRVVVPMKKESRK